MRGRPAVIISVLAAVAGGAGASTDGHAAGASTMKAYRRRAMRPTPAVAGGMPNGSASERSYLRGNVIVAAAQSDPNHAAATAHDDHPSTRST